MRLEGGYGIILYQDREFLRLHEGGSGQGATGQRATFGFGLARGAY